MSDTAQLFIVAGVWAVIAVFIAQLAPKWPARIITYALLVLVPFWELPIGYHNFQKICEREGRLRIFEAVNPQRLVCAAYPFDSSAPSLLDFGFDGAEGKDKTGKIVKFTKSPSGSTSSEIVKTLSSEYCISFVSNIHLPWRVLRQDFVVEANSSHTVVARHSGFYWQGMWWQAVVSPIAGHGGHCQEDPVTPIVTLLRNGSRN